MKRNMFLLLSFTLLLVFSLPQAFGQSDAPQPKEHNPFAVGVGVTVSSLGIGGQIGIPVTRKTNARFGFNFFSYSRDFEHSGINYNGSLKLRSMEALYDIFPFGHGFHISPGVLLYNGNKVEVKAAVPGGQYFDLGDQSYISSTSSPVTGNGELTMNKFAPMFVFGFGNLVPRTRHFSVTFDMGIVYHGAPKANLSLAGNVCDPSAPAVCQAVTTTAVQANLADEVAKLNKDAEPFKVWPVFRIGFGYKFGGGSK